MSRYLQLLKQVVAGAENLSQNRKHPQQESGNGDDGSNLVSTPEDDIQSQQYLLKVLFIKTNF